MVGLQFGGAVGTETFAKMLLLVYVSGFVTVHQSLDDQETYKRRITMSAMGDLKFEVAAWKKRGEGI
jgi:hypothetical protein